MAVATHKQMMEKLAELNSLRAQRGIDPVKHWRASYEGLLDAIKESKQRIIDNKKASEAKEVARNAPAPAPAKEKKGRTKATVPAPAPKEKKATAAKPAAVPAGPVKDAESFNAALNNREGTNQGKLATFLYKNIGKEMTNAKCAKEVYGDEKNKAISNVINGFCGKVAGVKGFSVDRKDESITLKKAK